MSGHLILLHLLGGVALLLFATRMVKTGVLRAFEERFRRAIGRATANPMLACLVGVGVATALQSSSATGLLVISFAERGLIGLAPALAVMLGADIGSTLAVQVLSLKLSAIVPVLLIGGVAAFMLSSHSTVQQIGRITIGLALMIMSLGMVVSASQVLRDSQVLGIVLSRLADDHVLAVAVGMLLTWLVHSSVAVVLLIISLATIGLVSPTLAMAITLGANLGSALIPLGLAARSPVASKRVLLGNFAFRVIGATVALPLVDLAATGFALLDPDPARQVANFHSAFNLVLALAFLPLTGAAALLLHRMVPEPRPGTSRSPIRHLDDSVLDRPALALGNATREVMRLADLVETMLRESILTFQENGDKRRTEIRNLDDEVDELQEEIKLYLTRMTREPLSEEESRQAFDLILFTTNLEHVGDIIDKSLLELAAKRQRLQVSFSPAGWKEIAALHARVVNQMRLAMTVFVTRDLKMARELVQEKDRMREAERSATESHLQRLRDGTVASLETSTLHLDIIRDLKRITAHITSVAYPILEANGEMYRTRLRQELDCSLGEKAAGGAAGG